ncbi:MAG: penicillin acylase family protein [Gammaproteobacteria bacterium]|nr:penicillin acylase family protein [Gammaproteobacteria bacterium]
MRLLRYLAAALGLVLLLGAGILYIVLRASLPPLDGVIRAPGLSAPVRITRDARGVPTVSAANRADLAFGTGFLHAQDRFFEMDLSRRLAAGELAELFGTVALEQDRRARLFRFRSVARAAMEQGSAEERGVLAAYSAGVNAGLAALRARPWEYWLLGAPPAAWRDEDALLVSYAMWWDLQSYGFRREMLRQAINAHLGGATCEGGWKCALGFLYPAGTSWDAPDAVGLVPPTVQPPVPGPEVLSTRRTSARATLPAPPPAALLGSNNWAVAGRLTASGAALIANDMHLTQRVPTIWYHARLQIPASAGQQALDLNGVTLPGAPLLVAGSNGHIAWGYTNSYGNWLHVEGIPCDSASDTEVRSGSGVIPLSVVTEQIRVKDGAGVRMAVRSGAPGLLLQVDLPRQTCWFGSWLAQVPSATNMTLIELERAGSVAEALAIAPRIGIPHQNAVIGDRDGHIAWTIFGRIPLDTGPERARGTGPYTEAAQHPRIVDPPAGRLWTANARVATDPQQLALIGGSVAALGAEYDLGARARQIRDDLMTLPGAATPADMLRIQLDDRALFLARWQALLLSVLDDASLAAHPQRAQFRRLVADWNARASTDSVGYRLVRAYHDRTQQAVWYALLDALQVAPDDEIGAPAQFEGPLWELLRTQPAHLLPAPYRDWREFLRAEVDATIEQLGRSCPELARCRWGSRNVVRIRHPLSRALPWLSGLLDMPTLEMPGDHDMPHVQEGNVGASERLAVSPGHEAEGYLVLPGGQSGHPLSPYYRSDFGAWARGEGLPLLPGAVQHTLTLRPR